MFEAKTHCPQGHVYDEQNTRWRTDKRGYRWKNCRRCQAESARRKRGGSQVSEASLDAGEMDVDVIAQPARSRGGAYKLCMGCGQNVLREVYRAGSSVCPRCEAVDAEPPGLVAEPEVAMAQAGVPAPLESVPGLQATVAGSADAQTWLASACGLREAGGLTLDVLATKVREMQAERTAMIGRVTRYGVPSGEVRPEDVPLETAAQTLYLACDPVVQERLTAACEVLRLNLNQVILGNLAYHEQDLLDQDASLVPQASYAAQYGTGGARSRPGVLGRSGLPGGRLLDAEGRLVKDCACCGREFHPPASRPNPDFCDDACGAYVDALRRWADTVVRDEMSPTYDGTPPRQPQPAEFWVTLAEGRVQEPYLGHAQAYAAAEVERTRRQSRERFDKMRGR